MNSNKVGARPGQLHGLWLALLTMVLAGPVHAATTIAVTTTNVGVDSADGLCSLDEAIDNANAGSAAVSASVANSFNEAPTPTPSAGISKPSHADCTFTGDGAAPYTITLQAGQTYTVSAARPTASGTGAAAAAVYRYWWYGPNAFPAVATTLIIEGNGAVIERAASLTSATPFRFFYVGADSTNAATSGFASPGAGYLTLRNLTLRNGLAAGGDGGGGGGGMGGAIFNQGMLSLERVTITDSAAVGGRGNYNGDFTGGGMGGGFNTDFGGGFAGIGPTGGAAGCNGGGGAGFAANGADGTPPTCSNGTPGAAGGAGGGAGGKGSSNYTGGAGGAFGNRGVPGSGSPSGGGGGGGVGSGGAPSGMFSAFTGSGSGGFGGGGAVKNNSNNPGNGGFGGGGGGATNNISQNFPGTSAFGGGSGGGSGHIAGGGGGAGMGGAIFNMQGMVTLLNSTLAFNTAAGGVGGNAGLFGAKGQGLGGAIFNLNGSLNVSYSTLARNTASTTGGALYNLSLSITGAQTAAVTLDNSILSNSVTATSDLVNNQLTGSATITYSDSNIVVTSTNTAGTITGTASTADPALDTALAANGATGAPQTLALLGGSPAIAAATGVCTTLDERNYARPASGCSLGAYDPAATIDTTPDAFSFTDVTGAAIGGGAVTSGSVTISGIAAAASVSVSGDSGAAVSIAGGAFGTSGSITNGQSVQVEVNAAAACNTTTSATVTVGGVPATFQVTTAACDTTPDSFSFTAVTGATKGASGIVSNTITIGGINTAAAVSISGDTGAKFSIDSGVFGTSGNITNSQTLQLELDAAVTCGVTTSASVTVGAASAVPYNVTTTACDRTPDDFSLNAVTGVDPSSAQASNPITVAGIDDGSSISISPVGTFTIDGGSAVTSGTINSGGKVIVQLDASSSYSTTRTATLTVGTVSKDFSVSTRAGNSTPTPFSFSAVTGAELGASVLSGSTVVTGLEVPAAISLDVGQFCINGTDAAHCHDAGTGLITVGNGDLVYVRLIASSSYSTKTTATLTIGGVSAPFDVTTVSAPQLGAPASIAFTDRTVGSHSALRTVTLSNAGGAALVISGSVAVSGANAADFPLTNSQCDNATIAAAGTCTFQLQFAPSAAGARSASIKIDSNDPANAAAVITLSGNGISVPPAPANLATTAGADQVTLNWDSATGATSYKIYQATTTGSTGSTPVASGITGTTRIITGLTAGTTYYFQVAGVNAGGTGLKSKVAKATVPVMPTVTIGVSLATVSSGTPSTLTWSSADTSTATTCTASGTPSNNTWTGTRSSKGGSISVTKITKRTYTYTLSCTNAAGTDTNSATLTVN